MKRNCSLTISFLGSRGIPRCYSGFETFVEEVSTRLAKRGHHVTVYNRVPFNKWSDDTYQGVRIVKIPTLPFKGTDTLVHSFLCTIHNLLSPSDIIYYCGVGSSIFCALAKLRGSKVIVNVDGADWERAKWGIIGKTWLRWSEKLAAYLSNSVVADHPAISEKYLKAYNRVCDLISYGAPAVEADPGKETLEKFSLSKKGYFLFVSRLTPENGADLVMKSYLEANTEMPLVIVGDAPYMSEYRETLQNLANASNGRILITGYQFGAAYEQLSFHARAFIFPTTIDATRPVLLEQMGMGSCIIARDTPANRHILDDAGVWFSNSSPLVDLSRKIEEVSASGFDLVARGLIARNRVRSFYNWDRVTEQYEDLFTKLLLPKGARKSLTPQSN